MSGDGNFGADGMLNFPSFFNKSNNFQLTLRPSIDSYINFLVYKVYMYPIAFD